MRKWFSIMVIVLFALAILAVAGVWQFKRVLNTLQLGSFKYQLETLNLHQVKFSKLAFVHTAETAQHTVDLRNVTVDWHWQSWFSPRLGVVSIEQAQVTQAALSDITKLPADKAAALFSLPDNWSVPESFPEQIHIRQLTVKLPCAAAHCTFAGLVDAVKFKTERMTTGVALKLKASPGEVLNTENQLMLDVAYTPEQQSPVTSNSSDVIKALTGKWKFFAKITEPLVIPTLGEFAGDINFELDIGAGKLNRYILDADVTAKHFVIPAALQTRGLMAEVIRLQIKSNMDSSVNLSSLPIEITGNTQGAVQANLAGRLMVDTAAKKITVEQFDLSAKIQNLKPAAGIELKNINADIHASGYWQPNRFALNLSTPSQIAADVVAQSFSVSAQNAQFSTSQLNISGDIAQGEIVWPQLTFSTDAVLKGGKFQHPQVNAKTWFWRGKAQGSLADFAVNGDIGMGASLLVKHQVKRKASALMLDWKVPDIFLLAANPFADSVMVWPPLLTLSRGKINASGNMLVDLEKNKLARSNTSVQLSDVSGVYDTLVFQGLSSQVKIITNDNSLAISTDELSVNHINKGFDLGPLAAAVRYKSSWEKPMQGLLDVQNFSGAAMGGSLSTAAQQFDFSRAQQNVKLELKDINLASLLKQYSSGEMSGTGVLSGSLPIEIKSTGISIAQGLVAAVAPGGQLQMKSERANAMAKNQPSMKLIVDALNDFHYTALASQINYDENGKLLLAITLKGRNPALERGRPVHLHINLEEDVPSMLASIQLSSKVSDIVKKRLQSRLQKKSTAQEKAKQTKEKINTAQ